MDSGSQFAFPVNWIRGFVVSVSALLAQFTALAAEFRCADLKPSQSQAPAYRRVAGQARCEGYFERNVSQPFIELVSLTASMPPKQEGGVLQISASRRAPMQLVVQPLRPGPFYRVDALIEASKPLRWDASPMLGATGLRLRDIGFLALSPGTDGTPSFVPVAFAASSEALQTANAVVRVSVPVARMSWRRLRLDGSDDGSGDWHEISGPARFAWDRVPITLPLPTDGRGVRIDVQAVDADQKILPLLQFNMAGPSDAVP